MVQRRRLCSAAVAVLFAAVATSAFAHGPRKFPTILSGYNETPATLNTAGGGEFEAKISKDETSIDYVLTYRDLASGVSQAHIHFGRPALSGGVTLFLCTNLAPPAGVPVPPPCPANAGTVTGTLTATNVIALPNQGIDAGAAGFAQIIEALRNGAAYANVHTTLRPAGEIRGQLGNAHREGDDDDDED